MLDWINLGEFLTLALLALALGMDAFSMALGLGMGKHSGRRTLMIAISVGLFHILMPLLGIFVGYLIGGYIGDLAVLGGSVLLIIFGLNMIYSSLFGIKKAPLATQSILALLFISLGVSLDSFSVGISLGMFAVTTWLAILLFGLFSFMLTWLGLFLGRQMGHWLGTYSEAVGGLILFALGLKFLF